MKKYVIHNRGCDDSNEFEIELNDEELKTIIKVFEANNEIAYYGCKPDIYIYEIEEWKKGRLDAKPLNKSYEELNDLESKGE